jgi:O-antigen/teichoic acid export membrane protein
MASKLMLVIAWPITLGTMAIAPLMIRMLGGEAFLPDSATALRILIWFLPLSYVNGVTQYVLIAANHQKSISLAFAIAVGFNIIANLALVPIYGHVAAAGITIATEFVLLAPLWFAMSRYVGDVGWVPMLAGPTLAAAPAGLALWITFPLGAVPALAVAGALYAGGLWLTGTIGRHEIDIARALVRRPAATG